MLVLESSLATHHSLSLHLYIAKKVEEVAMAEIMSHLKRLGCCWHQLILVHRLQFQKENLLLCRVKEAVIKGIISITRVSF